MRSLFLLALILAGFNGIFGAQMLWAYIMLTIVKRRLFLGNSLRAIGVFSLVSISSFLMSGIGAHILDPGSEPWFVLFVALGVFLTVAFSIPLWYWARQYAPHMESKQSGLVIDEP